MTSKQAIEVLKNEIKCVKTDCVRSECRDCRLVMSTDDILCALNLAIEALADSDDNIDNIKRRKKEVGE